MKIIKEFREFAVKGNMMDMAIGIIIGTAFGRIITSLVEDIIMPPFGYILGKFDFATLKLALKDAEFDAAGKIVKNAVTINYGNFIQVFINFIIIAISIFFFIKLMNMMRNKAEKKELEEAKPVPVPKDIELLTEIRDLLKK